MEPHYQRSSAIYKRVMLTCAGQPCIEAAVFPSLVFPQFGRKLPIFWDEMQLIQGELPYCIDTT